jgi:hypothetical protein
VEPVFGIIKAAMGFRPFLLRGLEKVNLEWELVTLAYDIKRLHARGNRPRRVQTGWITSLDYPHEGGSFRWKTAKILVKIIV